MNRIRCGTLLFDHVSELRNRRRPNTIKFNAIQVNRSLSTSTKLIASPLAVLIFFLRDSIGK